MKTEVCMCNISIEQKIRHLQGGIKTIRLHNFINHDTNLSDPWLRTVEHNSFRTCCKLSDSKTFNNYLCNISINIRI